MSIKKGVGESLRKYVAIFNEAALEVPTANLDVKVNALTQGLQPGDFFRSLAKKPTKMFDELLLRAEKYINLEEVTRVKWR